MDFALTAPSPCPCGADMPWHLFAIGDRRFTHHCGCGRSWKWLTSASALRTKSDKAKP